MAFCPNCNKNTSIVIENIEGQDNFVVKENAYVTHKGADYRVGHSESHQPTIYHITQPRCSNCYSLLIHPEATSAEEYNKIRENSFEAVKGEKIKKNKNVYEQTQQIIENRKSLLSNTTDYELLRWGEAKLKSTIVFLAIIPLIAFPINKTFAVVGCFVAMILYLIWFKYKKDNIINEVKEEIDSLNKNLPVYENKIKILERTNFSDNNMSISSMVPTCPYCWLALDFPDKFLQNLKGSSKLSCTNCRKTFTLKADGSFSKPD